MLKVQYKPLTTYQSKADASEDKKAGPYVSKDNQCDNKHCH